MPMDIYVNFGDIKGESTGKQHDNWVQAKATVQPGKTDIAQVAARLGVEHGSLVAANPHIKNPSALKAGQEVYLPTPPTPKASTPTEIQDKIHQGIQQAMQDIAHIARSIAGPAATQATNATSVSSADRQKAIRELADKYTEPPKQATDNAKF